MREIKFRAFDPSTNDMVELGVLELDRNRGHGYYGFHDGYSVVTVYFDPKNGEAQKSTLMQFTGIKDKNEVEIYEGDICLKYWSEEVYGKRDPVKGVVKWVSFGGRYTLEWIDEFGTKRYEELHENLIYPEYPRSLLEVIGNIYQNKELLNK
jgi:uncharacterized phage protein (TIGR01671 family)